MEKNPSKERLKKILGKKFSTVMIFPLSQFETAFGHLWGMGKEEKDLTEAERILQFKWQECRNNILNLGNTQKRNAFAELELYDISWQGYKSVFLPIKEKE